MDNLTTLTTLMEKQDARLLGEAHCIVTKESYMLNAPPVFQQPPPLVQSLSPIPNTIIVLDTPLPDKRLVILDTIEPAAITFTSTTTTTTTTTTPTTVTPTIVPESITLTQSTPALQEAIEMETTTTSTLLTDIVLPTSRNEEFEILSTTLQPTESQSAALSLTSSASPIQQPLSTASDVSQSSITIASSTQSYSSSPSPITPVSSLESQLHPSTVLSTLPIEASATPPTSSVTPSSTIERDNSLHETYPLVRVTEETTEQHIEPEEPPEIFFT